MCFIMAVKNGKQVQGLDNSLQSILASKEVSNPDGHAVYEFAGQKVAKGIGGEQLKNNLDKFGMDNIMVHLRYATQGRKTDDNIHAWDLNGLVFMHNGWISNIKGGLSNHKADSRVFFEQLSGAIGKATSIKKIAHKFAALAQKEDFSGRALLYDKRTDNLFVFGDFEVYAVNNTALVLTSIDIDLENMANWVNVCGTLFYDDEIKTGFKVLNKTTSGIGVFKGWSGNSPQWEYIQALEKPISNYNGNYTGNNSRHWDAEYKWSSPYKNTITEGKQTALPIMSQSDEEFYAHEYAKMQKAKKASV